MGSLYTLRLGFARMCSRQPNIGFEGKGGVLLFVWWRFTQSITYFHATHTAFPLGKQTEKGLWAGYPVIPRNSSPPTQNTKRSPLYPLARITAPFPSFILN